MNLEPPIFLALDVDDREQALSLAEKTKDYVGGFKLGPRLCMRYGAELVQEVSKYGPVFVDNKYYDIPNTMAYAIRATFDSGASFATVHALSGEEALTQLSGLEARLNKIREFNILVVTILTSFDESTLPPVHKADPINEQVDELVKMSIDCGLNKFVCSAHELEKLKAKYPTAWFVTPGIRFPKDEKGDQKRVMGPKEAMALGASGIVVGRPIYEAEDPALAAKKFLEAVS